MRAALRVCRRLQEGEGSFALVALASVGVLFAMAAPWTSAWVCAATVRPREYHLHLWLLLLLAWSYVAWMVLRLWGRIDASGGPGFVLAAFGLAASWLCHLCLYGLSETYGETSLVEQVADTRLRVMIAVHLWGGPLAILVGLLVVLFGSRRPRYSSRVG